MCHQGISNAQTWLGAVREGRSAYLLGIKQAEAEKRQKQRVAEIETIRGKVKEQLEKFREMERYTYLFFPFTSHPFTSHRRHAILEPYRHAFDADGYHTPTASHPSSPVNPVAHSPTDATGHIGLGLSNLDKWRTNQAPVQDKEWYNTAPGSASIKHEERYGERDELVMPPHRYLFYCYVYHYNLIQIASIVIEMVRTFSTFIRGGRLFYAGTGVRTSSR